MPDKNVWDLNNVGNAFNDVGNRFRAEADKRPEWNPLANQIANQWKGTLLKEAKMYDTSDLNEKNRIGQSFYQNDSAQVRNNLNQALQKMDEAGIRDPRFDNYRRIFAGPTFERYHSPIRFYPNYKELIDRKQNKPNFKDIVDTGIELSQGFNADHSIEPYLSHYFNNTDQLIDGKKPPIYFEDMGLKEKFINHPTVRGAQEELNQRIVNQLSPYAERLKWTNISEIPIQRNSVPSIATDFTDKNFSIGRNSLQASYEGKLRKNALGGIIYDLNIDYNVPDEFENPLDIGGLEIGNFTMPNIEVPPGKPYGLKTNWRQKLTNEIEGEEY
jgi:hypothetical protein